MGLCLDPLRAENQALPTQKGVEWPLLRIINQSTFFYHILKIYAVFDRFFLTLLLCTRFLTISAYYGIKDLRLCCLLGVYAPQLYFLAAVVKSSTAYG